MTDNNVIRPAPDYWQRRPKENNHMHMSRTREECEAALCWLAVLEAGARFDQHACDVLLEPWRDNLGPILRYALLMCNSLIGSSITEPDMFIGGLRNMLLTDLANSDRR